MIQDLTIDTLQTLCTRIEPGLEQQIVLPRDSYLQVKYSIIHDVLAKICIIGLPKLCCRFSSVLLLYVYFNLSGIFQKYFRLPQDWTTCVFCGEELQL